MRYVDDFVVGFQSRRDAMNFLEALKERLHRFALELHDDITRPIEFGRYAISNRRARGQGRPETFDFLGFTYYCRITRKGRFGLGRKPIAKRMFRTLKHIKKTLRSRMYDPFVVVAKWLRKVINGWLGYYAVPTSFRYLKTVCLSSQKTVVAGVVPAISKGRLNMETS